MVNLVRFSPLLRKEGNLEALNGKSEAFSLNRVQFFFEMSPTCCCMKRCPDRPFKCPNETSHFCLLSDAYMIGEGAQSPDQNLSKRSGVRKSRPGNCRGSDHGCAYIFEHKSGRVITTLNHGKDEVVQTIGVSV